MIHVIKIGFTMKKYFILYIVSFFFLYSDAQEGYRIKSGLYYGGDFYEGSKSTGYYWFSKDSFLVMASFRKDSSLVSFGIGKYYVTKQNLLIRIFEKVPELTLKSNKVEYYLSTITPTDSLFFRGTIFDSNDRPVKMGTIFFENQENKKYRTDTNGNYSFAIPISQYPSKIIYNSVYGCPLSLELVPNYNLYRINVSLNNDCLSGSIVSTFAYEVIKEKRDTSKIKKIENNTIRFAGPVKFERIAENNQILIAFFEKAKIRQPHLALLINWVANKL